MKAQLILFKKTATRKEFMIRLTEEGNRSYKAVNPPFSETQWNYNPKKRKNELKVRTPRHPEYKTYQSNKDWVEALELQYQGVIDDLIRLNKPFTFNKVFSLVEKPKTDKPKSVYKLFDYRSKELKANDKFGTAEGYTGTLNKLKAFHTKDMLFSELDDKLLLQFKKHLHGQGLSVSTISIHLRNIRALYNYAIRNAKVANRNDYPFENQDIMKELKAGYKSRAISKQEVDAIRKLKAKTKTDSDLWHACNYFLFGYLGRGINFQDMARLKWDNIKQGRVTFIRHKTRYKIQEETSFTLNHELLVIIEQYRGAWKAQPNYMHNPYVFPVLNPSYQKEVSIFNRIKKIRKQVNSDLKNIGEKIGAEIPITTYTWRHSFAAVAKNDLKVDVSMISEMLGHHDLETTKHYLKQFSHDDKDKALAGL